MATLSAYLDADIALGEVYQIHRLITRPTETVVWVEMSDGSWWEYLDQNSAMTTGEIARQILGPGPLSHQS